MYKRILVAFDGSETAKRGLKEAAALAAELKSTLHVLHVTNEYAMVVDLGGYVDYQSLRDSFVARGTRLLDEARALVKPSGVTTETTLLELNGGRVADAIIEEATKAGCELIVLGTHGRRGLSRALLGSDAETVLRASPVPVLLIRNPDPV